MDNAKTLTQEQQNLVDEIMQRESRQYEVDKIVAQVQAEQAEMLAKEIMERESRQHEVDKLVAKVQAEMEKSEESDKTNS